MDKKKNVKSSVILMIICIIVFIVFLSTILDAAYNVKDKAFKGLKGKEHFSIIATDESKDICDILEKKFNIDVTYAGSLEIIDILNQNEDKYDAVFLSNSIWMAMLDSSKCKISDYSTISINPVVFGVKKSVAKNLGLIKDGLVLNDIVNVIKDGKLKFAMPSGTQTNTGASSLLGFTCTLCGNPEVLTFENIDDNLSVELKSLFSGVDRSSGSEAFVEQLYLTGKYDAAILYETSIININKQLKNEDDMIYALYPIDGVSVSDLIFGMVDSSKDKKEKFDEMKEYILSTKVQEELESKGHRVWYGGVKEDVDKTVFNKDWGIDTTKYITPIKYPSLDVIKSIFALYQSELRKPTHTVFALDYSGSMYGDGYNQLSEAMEYILDVDKASKDYVQFSKSDKVTIIPFSTDVIDVYSTTYGDSLDDLISKIKNTKVTGGTNIYDSVTKALNLVKNEDFEKYNITIVVMTDGVGNNGSKKNMISTYNSINKDIPVYSILFGDASKYDMQEIADLTGAMVFDGRKNLKYAFKQVRGYN